MQVSAFPTIFKADFGSFRRVSAFFQPVSAVSAGPIWPIRPDFGRISPVRRESKPIRRELSRNGANRAASARIQPIRLESEKKKKKNSDAAELAINRVGRRVPRRVASRPVLCCVGRGCDTSGAASVLSSFLASLHSFRIAHQSHVQS